MDPACKLLVAGHLENHIHCIVIGDTEAVGSIVADPGQRRRYRIVAELLRLCRKIVLAGLKLMLEVVEQSHYFGSPSEEGSY